MKTTGRASRKLTSISRLKVLCIYLNPLRLFARSVKKVFAQKFKDIVKALKDAKLFQKPMTGELILAPMTMGTGKDVDITIMTKLALSKTQAQSWSSRISYFPSVNIVTVC